MSTLEVLRSDGFLLFFLFSGSVGCNKRKDPPEMLQQVSQPIPKP